MEIRYDKGLRWQQIRDHIGLRVVGMEKIRFGS
jgi:hypothetical protein